MKKILLMLLAITSLSSKSQKFWTMFSDTSHIGGGRIELWPKYSAVFVNKVSKDTIRISPYFSWKESDKTVYVSCFFVSIITNNEPVQLVFKNSAINLGFYGKYDEESNLYTNKQKDNNSFIDTVKVIRFRGNAYYPIGGTSEYFISYIGNFERLKYDWLIKD